MADRPVNESAYSENGVLYYRNEGVVIRAEAWGRDGLRIRIKKEGVQQTSDYALDIPSQGNAQINITPQVAEIINGKITLNIYDIYTQKGYMVFFSTATGERKEILREYDWQIVAHNPGTHSLDEVDNGLYRARLCFDTDDGEKLYGMGGNAANHLGLKGRVIELYQRHSKAVVPFVISNRGYGFLWNNPALGHVEFGRELTRWEAEACRQIDYYITVGDNYADILENYTAVTGRAPQFPAWASGFWQCKYRYENQEQVLEVAREFHRLGLPVSVIVIDMSHWKHAGDWSLDPEYWPDVEGMVKECAEYGIRLAISPWPMVSTESENYRYMRDNGMLTGWRGHPERPFPFAGENANQYDPTNPEAGKYMMSRWKKNYMDRGIKTFWLDTCDEIHGIPQYGNVSYHIGSGAECHAAYVTAHQKNVYQGLARAGEDEIITICRNAWAGSQRWGACPAPHDIRSSFLHLRQYMIYGLNMAVSGIGWWNCDIGGFIAFIEGTDEFYELMVRWYQWGVFMPVFRTHSGRKNNEPWNVGSYTYPHIRECLFMRERLRPYVAEQMKKTSEKGFPIVRPLYFDSMDDPDSYDITDEFLFGEDFLVAPATEYGMRSRKVYLPKGSNWVNVRTSEVFEGGKSIVADCPLDYIPVFVKEGSEALGELVVTQAPEEANVSE